jgi:glutamate dehydrogenase
MKIKILIFKENLIYFTGIDREALNDLVKNRSMCIQFKGKLSPQGYFVSINDEKKTLPNGQFVESGVVFRNTFHLRQLYLI